MNKKYDNIIIPKELDFMIQKTIKKDKKRRQVIKTFTGIAAALLLFTTTLNISPSFANNLKDVPLLGGLADLLTFRSYETSSDDIKADVTLPEVHLEDTKLDDYINQIINQKVEEVLAEAEIRAAEYKEAYLDTGGTEAGYKEKNMQVIADYEIFSQDEDYLSFRVYTHESLAAVYASNLYFTLDLKNKSLLNLEDLLGSDYVNIMTQEVLEKIEADEKENPGFYFDDYKADDFKVREDIAFYMKDKQVFIVFEKYELAPGVAGRLEFNIPLK